MSPASAVHVFYGALNWQHMRESWPLLLRLLTVGWSEASLLSWGLLPDPRRRGIESSQKTHLCRMKSELSIELYLTENGTFALGHLFEKKNKVTFNVFLISFNEHWIFPNAYRNKWYLGVGIIIIENRDYKHLEANFRDWISL